MLLFVGLVAFEKIVGHGMLDLKLKPDHPIFERSSHRYWLMHLDVLTSLVADAHNLAHVLRVQLFLPAIA